MGLGWAGLVRHFYYFLYFLFLLFFGGGEVENQPALFYSMAKGGSIDQLCVCVFVLFCLHCHEPLLFHGWLGIEACQPRRIALCRQDLHLRYSLGLYCMYVCMYVVVVGVQVVGML